MKMYSASQQPSCSSELNRSSHTIRCMCCLTIQGPFVNLFNCEHILNLFTALNGNKFKYACVYCHSLLVKFRDFRCQVDESIKWLESSSAEIQQPSKKVLHLRRTAIKVHSTNPSDYEAIEMKQEKAMYNRNMVQFIKDEAEIDFEPSFSIEPEGLDTKGPILIEPWGADSKTQISIEPWGPSSKDPIEPGGFLKDSISPEADGSETESAEEFMDFHNDLDSSRKDVKCNIQRLISGGKEENKLLARGKRLTATKVSSRNETEVQKKEVGTRMNVTNPVDVRNRIVDSNRIIQPYSTVPSRKVDVNRIVPIISNRLVSLQPIRIEDKNTAGTAKIPINILRKNIDFPVSKYQVVQYTATNENRVESANQIVGLNRIHVPDRIVDRNRIEESNRIVEGIQVKVEIEKKKDQGDINLIHDPLNPFVNYSSRYLDREMPDLVGKIRIIELTQEQLSREQEVQRNDPTYLQQDHKCDVCVKTFAEKASLTNHILRQHGTKKPGYHTCRICERKYKNIYALREHLTRHFSRYVCEQCGFMDPMLDNAVKHYREKHGNIDLKEYYKCFRCNFLARCKTELKHHKLKHFPFKCPLCVKTFKQKSTLDSHMRNIHKDSKEHKCKECGKGFDSIRKLHLHVKNTHGKEAAYCSTCDKRFKNELSLKVHLRTHAAHVGDRKRYICDDCGLAFRNKSTLMGHIITKHLPQLTQTCEVCAKNFPTIRRLNRHIDMVHKNIKPPKKYICDHCGKGFCSSTLLRVHIRVHTGEKPLSCKLCEATFAHPAALYTHTKLKHKAKLVRKNNSK